MAAHIYSTHAASELLRCITSSSSSAARRGKLKGACVLLSGTHSGLTALASTAPSVQQLLLLYCKY
eukprot:5704-Heterococcus_DN1.PRE.1